MNDVVTRSDKMKKLSPNIKVGFVIPSFVLGTISCVIAVIGYFVTFLILSSCSSDSHLGPKILTPKNPHYGKATAKNSAYNSGKIRNSGGKKKFHGYQTN